MTKIYVGNLPFSADESQVRELFSQHGTVESVSIITDRETGRPRGFGFVEMSRADASRAIQNLNGKDMGGRPPLARVLRDWGLALRRLGRTDEGNAKLSRSIDLFREMGIANEADEAQVALTA